MKVWLILIRREFWEGRGLWIAPLAVAAFMVVMAGLSVGGSSHVHTSFGSANLAFTADALRASVNGIAWLMLLVGGLSVTSYLLDCLYAERKDRSILFWKSLPVSDTQTVLSKFLVAAVIVPLGIFVLAAITHLACSLLVWLLFVRPAGIVGDGWSMQVWLDAQGDLLGRLLVTLLWWAPLNAYLILGSVWARRAPLVTVVLPPLVIAAAQNILFSRSDVWQFLLRRLAPIGSPAETLASPELWLGLVAAVALLAVVIRLRRYRDDT